MKILDQQEKTVKQLQQEGFDVQCEVTGASGAQYDLIAQRNGQSIVFEIKAQSRLNLDSAEISRLRQSARQDGYSDFRLIVVPEERPTSIEISGLDKALLSWVETHAEIKLATPLENCDVAFRRLEQVQISSLMSESGRSGTNVSGMAVVEFSVVSIPEDVVWDCPLYFDVRLDENWRLESVEKIDLDIMSIRDDLQEYLQEHFDSPSTQK